MTLLDLLVASPTLTNVWTESIMAHPVAGQSAVPTELTCNATVTCAFTRLTQPLTMWATRPKLTVWLAFLTLA
mgnify:CR=1 FL=1